MQKQCKMFQILLQITLFDKIAIILTSDRMILIFRTDADYLYVYVPDNRYAEPIFINCYKVNK